MSNIKKSESTKVDASDEENNSSAEDSLGCEDEIPDGDDPENHILEKSDTSLQENLNPDDSSSSEEGIFYKL